MKLSEKNFTIFTSLNTNYTNILLFEYVYPETLDTTYNSLFGNRELSTLGKNKDSDEIADIIYSCFVHDWNALIESEKAALNIVKLGGIKTEESNNTPIPYERTTTRELASYSTNALQNESRETEVYTPSEDETGHNSITTTSKTSDSIIKAKTLLLNDIINGIIFRDVNNITTILVMSIEMDIEGE